MNRTRVTSLVVAVILGGLALIGRPTHATTLVPPSLEFSVKPGDTVSSTLKLFNETAGTLQLFSSTAAFTAKDTTGTPKFAVDPDSKDLSSWVTIATGPFSLQPNERIEVPITIKVPANADPGGHYAAVFFGDTPPVIEGSGVSVQTKIGTLIILTVQGQINEVANLQSFTATGKNVLTRPPVNFKVLVNNQGNVHVRPEGTISIHNMFGGQTATLVLNSSRGAVLPNSTREFDIQWAKGLTTTKSGNFFRAIGDEWNNFGLGSYTASLSMTYGVNQQVLTGEYRFTIFPWQLLLVILIAVVIIILILTYGIRGYNKMIIRKAQSAAGKQSPTSKK